MAQIGVTELLHDPDFVDGIQLVSRCARVDHLGQNVVSEQATTTYGSVQPATGKVIQRLPEALRVADVSSFWLKGTIEATGPGSLYPSILVFRGRRYQVQTVADWTNWGPGYTEGTCVAEKPA